MFKNCLRLNVALFWTFQATKPLNLNFGECSIEYDSSRLIVVTESETIPPA